VKMSMVPVPPSSAQTSPKWGRRRARLTAAGQQEAATAKAIETRTRSAYIGRVISVQLGAVGCGSILAGFLLFVPDCVHWFVIPVFCCGCIVAADAVDWLRIRRGLLDPVGIIGMLGLHFFFLAPLLQVAWKYSVAYVVPPDDWRPWLGWMACLNVAGLCLYRAVVTTIERRADPTSKTMWVLRAEWFWPVLAVGLVGSLILQSLVYSMFGGVGGYIDAFSSRFAAQEFKGLGLVSIFAESFPIQVMFAYAVYVRRTGRGRSWLTVAAVVVCFIALRVYFGGLRGSRAAYVWPLFWSAGIIHIWVRPIRRSVVLAAAVVLVLFMYGYGLYKAYGSDVVLIITRDDVGERARERNRGLDTTLLSDLGRSDIQAYVLYKLFTPRARMGYEYAVGRTYLGSISLMIPASLWPDRPPPKTKEGTELMFGKGTWNTRHYIASYAYGLAGETMLNFGPAAVPIAYGLFGVLVGSVVVLQRRIRVDDARVLILPYIMSLCPFVLIWDSDVIIVYILSQAIVPLLLLRASSRVSVYQLT
jgi:hypothetical protein